ncbi:MAG: hypothetical protein FDZ75_02525, partial [Actinobacteria bacterium]
MSGRRRRLSASSRVLLAMTGVLAVSIAMLVVVAFLVTRVTLAAALDDSLTREADAFMAAMRSAPSSETLAGATRAYLGSRDAGAEGADTILLVTLSDGRTISNSDLRLEAARANLDVRTPPARATYRDIAFAGTRYRVLTVPLVRQGSSVGIFQAALSTGAAEQTARRVAITLTAAGLIALALGLPLSY